MKVMLRGTGPADQNEVHDENSKCYVGSSTLMPQRQNFVAFSDQKANAVARQCRVESSSRSGNKLAVPNADVLSRCSKLRADLDPLSTNSN